MKIINKILIIVTMALLMNTPSIYAAKNTLLVSPNYLPQNIQKINSINEEESPALPHFEVEDFQYNYHLTNKESYISFILSSTEFVSYYIYLINDDSTIFHETSGFINQYSKKIELTLENITPGDYDLVVEVYNNEKISARKTFPLIFK
ncbi:TPA: hypothetical protein R1Z88_001458 [Yersinia enterocolitica]|nr:hypothetical protein [Yersinia enterocolitica]HEC1639510.1 hypothetical protein [Yersinia enterocolitica]HEN3296484.1 hypothetical protein [Yersinia enterocolitica]